MYTFAESEVNALSTVSIWVPEIVAHSFWVAKGNFRCVFYMHVTDGCPVATGYVCFSSRVINHWHLKPGCCSASVPPVNWAGEAVFSRCAVRPGCTAALQTRHGACVCWRRSVGCNGQSLPTQPDAATISALISVIAGSPIARQRLLPRATVAITTPLSSPPRMPMIGHHGGVTSSGVGRGLEDAHDGRKFA